MKPPPKRWNIKNSIIMGAVAGIVAVLFNLKDYQGGGLAHIVGGFIGGMIGGAFMFGLVALLRNRLIFGKGAVGTGA